MLLNHSGRGSPAKPGWVGTRTCALDSPAVMPATVCGPPPPCKMRMGRPLSPRSSKRTVKPSAKDSFRVLIGAGNVFMEFTLSVGSISIALYELLEQAME